MKTRSCFVSVLALVGALAAVTGCSPFDSQTTGARGRATFQYSRACFLDCALDHPVAVGSTERIIVTGDGAVPDISVKSGDATVATFAVTGHACSCQLATDNGSTSYGPVPDNAACSDGYQKSCSNEIEASARAEGDVELAVLDASGATIDTTTIHIRRAAGVGVMSDDRQAADHVTGRYGDVVSLRATLVDADGNTLLSPGALKCSSRDGKVAHADLGNAWFDGSAGDALDVYLVGAGDTTVDVTGGGASATLPVHVDP